ncbi:LytTR family transcriptional regulator DNA-binding domain-containing protein [Virgibacillus sp. Bac332]|uniref:LytTR family transcriptional regulator DNA-binding domain-containing protein n=1 Tax=Virgibacillus sp. Bac332 TaxID=2419842 RepID=UPI000EF55893|nr:LytTR family transcriptional regulator DNA-binding domain-containing protein [Virgibacillus sp. Bac332]
MAGLLVIYSLEKRTKDSIIFPIFNLTIEKGDITAVYSTLNIRKVLLEIISGKTLASKGEIRINGVTIMENRNLFLSGVVLAFYEDGIYDRLKVRDYFSFYRAIYDSNQTIDQLLRITQLQDKQNQKIKTLTYSEKQRVRFGKQLLQHAELYIFEEPDLNVDVETRQVFISITRRLQHEGKGVLILTGNLESALTIADQVLRIDESGLQQIPTEKGESDSILDDPMLEAEVQPFQLNKIPTKVNDKIVLFDPPEIDYIESNDGQSHIYSNGNLFTSASTLNELESRLEHFGFFRCHRSYIVNLQKVREVITWTRNSYSLILNNKEKTSIPLSKSKMAQLKDMLGMK